MDITGSVTAALMLSQLVYWTNHKIRAGDANLWVFKTRDDWTEETGLTRREQETARKALQARGLAHEQLKGVPAKLHFKINHEALRKALDTPPSQLARKRPTSWHESAQLDGTKAPNKKARFVPSAKAPNRLGGKRPTYTEITSETTSKNKTIPYPSVPEGVRFEVQLVMRECHFTNDRLAPVIGKALEEYRRREAIDAAVAAKLMVDQWQKFTSWGPYLRYTWSPRKWITEGHWVHSDGWPIDYDRADRERQAKTGRVQ